MPVPSRTLAVPEPEDGCTQGSAGAGRYVEPSRQAAARLAPIGTPGDHLVAGVSPDAEIRDRKWPFVVLSDPRRKTGYGAG